MGEQADLNGAENPESQEQTQSPFAFEKQLNNAGETMDQESVKKLNAFRQKEMEIDVKLEMAESNIESETRNELESELNAFLECSIEAKKTLPTEYSKSERPKDAKHIWDQGKEFDKRTAYRASLTAMDFYIDDSIEQIGSRFKKVRNQAIHQEQPYVVPALSILDSETSCQDPELTPEYQDIMGFHRH